MPFKQHGRQYDLVLFGATGYTGKYTAEHIATYLPIDLKWAIVGRSSRKLEQIKGELETLAPGRRQPDIEIVNLNDADLTTLAKKTFLLITTVGPYGLYGEHAFKACASNGTHYLDTTGEITFTALMINKYSSIAKESGSMLFPQMGLESSPADLVTWSLAKYNRTEFQAKTKNVVLSVHTMDSMPSGGTITSLLSIFDITPLPKIIASMTPYALSPVPKPRSIPSESLVFLGTRSVPHLGRLTTFISGAMDRAIVHRTWGIFSQISSKRDEFYGENFSFEEYMKCGNWLSGKVIHWGLVGTAWVLAKSPVMRGLVRKVVFKAGEGPDVDKAKGDMVEYWGVATPDSENEKAVGKKAFARAVYSGSMYSLTGAFLAQAAATLLEDDVDFGVGGIFTPACLGQGFVDRLDSVGFKIRLETKTA